MDNDFLPRARAVLGRGTIRTISNRTVAEHWFRDKLQEVKDNNPNKKQFVLDVTDSEFVENMTVGDWEELGQDINNNTHLRELSFSSSLNNRNMMALFRGLTGGNSIKEIHLYDNGFSEEGVWSMVPFLQNDSNLKNLDVSYNGIGSEGFNTLILALFDSPIERLVCTECVINSIEIDDDCFPLNLRELHLNHNEINTDGCRELAKLLQGGDSKLEKLDLDNNWIDDEGVAILVEALENNTSLRELHLEGNRGITTEGRKLLLKLVNDVSSIKATLKSNHRLWTVDVSCWGSNGEEIEEQISAATYINGETYGPDMERIAKEKVIQTQLHSAKREQLHRLQGAERANDAVYNEIDPLHLPEVLSMVGRAHGLSEFHVAIKSSMAVLVSTVDKEIFIQQKRDYHAARVAELDAELAAIRRAKVGPHPQFKRQRI